MRENSSISEYRDRLDKTLSSHDLTNVETLRALVKKQFMVSPQIIAEEDVDNIIEIRTTEVSHFLGMLRSTSDDGWKIKQDSEEFRVMYREGPEGSPFHTLLVEGYVDGPLDVCLCISWEAELYQKWWPQTAVPTFKITSSRCLKKIRDGEQICLVRMKVSWPLSTREALIHYFELEYFQDDLVVVLLNSISDLDGISKSTHGFTRDGIPDAEDVIRIDVVGGFAIQKVSANRSYFRTIANMDIKLDLIPPALMNFISRQLVGSGFKLYKKEVASVTKGDDDFSKALTDPLYTHVREAILGDSLSKTAPEIEGLSKKSSVLFREQCAEEDGAGTAVDKIHCDNLGSDLEAKGSSLQEMMSQQEIVEIMKEKHESNIKDIPNSEIEEIMKRNDETAERFSPENAIKKMSHSEIEEIKEEDEKDSESLSIDANRSFNAPKNGNSFSFSPESGKEVVIRPEVEKALRTLEKAITVIRQHGLENKTTFSPLGPLSQNPDKDGAKESVSSDADQTGRKDGIMLSPSLLKEDPATVTSNEARNSSGSIGSRRQGSNSYLRDTNHSKIAPASPNEDAAVLSGTCHNDMHSSHNHASGLIASEKITHEYDNVTEAAGNYVDESRQQRRKRKPRYLCWRAFSWR